MVWLPHLNVTLAVLLGYPLCDVIVGSAFMRFIVLGVLEENVVHIRTGIFVEPIV